MRLRTPPDATCEQPPERRRWTTTYCKAECGQRHELPMPTQRQLAGPVHVHETSLPFQAQLLPLRWSAARSSRCSQDILPRPPQKWRSFWDFARLPPGEVVVKQLHVLNEHRAERLINRLWEHECRPRVNFALNQRHVPFSVHRSTSEV